MNRLVSEENILKTRKLTSLANELGIKTSQLALAWCLKNPNVSTAIIGATSPNQIKENVDSVHHLSKLTNQVMNAIQEIIA